MLSDLKIGEIYMTKYGRVYYIGMSALHQGKAVVEKLGASTLLHLDFGMLYEEKEEEEEKDVLDILENIQNLPTDIQTTILARKANKIIKHIVDLNKRMRVLEQRVL